VRDFLRGNRRPAFFVLLSVLLLTLHHVLLRVAVHQRLVHLFEPIGRLGIALLVVRLIVVLLVPGFLLAAAAEILAYFLVGPPHAHQRFEDE
jgi:hypothetical protein